MSRGDCGMLAWICLLVTLVITIHPSQQCGGGGGGDNGAAVEAQRESRQQELRLWCTDNCVSQWGFWSQCTKPCAGGTQTRTRTVTNHQWCTDLQGFSCPHALSQSKTCNEGCSYGGTVQSGSCACPDTRKGQCCEQERLCEYPGRPQYGSVTGSWPARIGSIAQFSCEQGFELVGDNFRRCKKEGWDNQQPTCDRIMCSPPEVVAEHVRLLNVKDGYVFGDIVMYGCQDGYTLEGPQLRECIAAPGGGGRWDGFDPICDSVKCPDPGLPLHGSREGHDLTYMSVMTFECDAGFKLVGTATLTCLASGTWLGHFPTCEAIQCDAPPVPDNGRLRIHRVDNIPAASFTCDDGYLLEGPESITCGDFGEWDEEAPTCRAVDCGEPAVPANGYIQGSATTFPNNVTFACHLGYKLIGATGAQCLESGSWSHAAPTCQVCPLNTYYDAGDCLDCPANSKTATEGSTSIIQCTCDFGYNGEPGSECVQTQCMELDPPTFGQVVSCERTVGGQCSFTCDDGYVMARGTNIRTCQVTGAWDGEDPFCGPCKVDTYKSSERSCSPCPEHTHTLAAAQMLDGCICDNGFIGEEGGPCEDVDECLEEPCQDECENNIGSYACRCTIPGYKNDPADFRRCIAELQCRNLTTEDAPDNGGFICKWFTQENSQFCGVRCNPDYEHPVRANEYETCGPVTNYTWSFQVLDPTASIPPCIKAFFPGIRLQADAFYFTSNCKDLTPDEQEAVKQQFAGLLTEKGVCVKDDDKICDISDMGIICGEETRRKRRDAEDEIVQSMELAFNVTGLKTISTEEECGPEICQQLGIPAAYCTRELCVRVYNRYIRAAVQFAEGQLNALYRTAEQRNRLTLDVAGRTFEPAEDGLRTSGILADCDDGMEWQELTEACVACLPGSYLSGHNRTCVACPVMTYQRDERQLECIPCPTGTHNNQSGLAYCLACEQGRYGDHCAFQCECVNGGCDPIYGKCICPPGYEGEQCEIDIPGCRDQHCATGVTCYDVPAPNTGITCGPCPSGTHGDGFSCTPNGPGAMVVTGITS